MKVCKKCFLEKSFSEFYPEPQKKDGYRTYCKLCISNANKMYGLKNKDKISQYNKSRVFSDEYVSKRNAIKREKYNNNKDFYKQQRLELKQRLGDRLSEHKKNWYLKNKEYCNKRNRDYYHKNKKEIGKKNIERSKIDVQFKLRNSLRKRISKFVSGKFKKASAIRDLGCSVDFLKKYLESKFLNGMSWENYGVSGWHIDHIKPLSKFDLTDESQLKEACHYTNLQPLWWYDNINKGNLDFEEWIKKLK